MSRRCKPGQRAKVINDTANRGKIVLVICPYFGEKFPCGGHWPKPLFPWVVTSLGTPFDWVMLDDPSIGGTSMTIAICDTELEPLDDDDDGLTRSTEKDKPIKRPKAKQAPKKVSEVQS